MKLIPPRTKTPASISFWSFSCTRGLDRCLHGTEPSTCGIPKKKKDQYHRIDKRNWWLLFLFNISIIFEKIRTLSRLSGPSGYPARSDASPGQTWSPEFLGLPLHVEHALDHDFPYFLELRSLSCCILPWHPGNSDPVAELFHMLLGLCDTLSSPNGFVLFLTNLELSENEQSRTEHTGDIQERIPQIYHVVTIMERKN